MQPNPFVNPHQRGFELPAGCKDLNDVLASVGQGQVVPTNRVEAGGINAIRSYLGRLYEARSPRLVLVVMNSERGAVLMVAYVGIRFELSLLLHRGSTFLEEAILELFGEAPLLKASEKNEELPTVHIPLPDFSEDAAQRLIDLLIRGYGLTDGARLLFHFQEKKAGESQ